MIGMSFKSLKGSFFDTTAVTSRLPRARAKVLSQQGGLVRKIAQQSMRYRAAGKASAPGTPPHAHSSMGALLRKLLFYAYERVRETVVVGPLGGGQASTVPELQEFGGNKRARNPKRRPRKVGEPGEIDVRAGAPVFAVLETQAQADRANQINAELYGPEMIEADYPKRPYMAPALETAGPKLAGMWANSIT